MAEHTRTAVLAILRADPNLDAERIAEAMKILDGKSSSSGIAPLEIDRVVTFADAAALTHRDKRTLRNWEKKGLLRFVQGAGGRAIGVSAESLKEFLGRTKAAKVA